MEPNTQQQSFIPHEAATIERRVSTRGSAELFSLVALVLFVASAALAAGVFLYSEYLQTSATSKIDQLRRAEAAFEPSLIRELTRLDDRMRAAGEILNKHIAPTTLFGMLEQTTIETVAFSSLDFGVADAQSMVVEMAGVAASVNSVALQADLFSKGGMITSPIFSDISRQADGVHFSLSAQINPAAINYSQIPAQISTPVPQEQQQQSTSPFGGTTGVEESAGTTTPEERVEPVAEPEEQSI